MLETQAATGTEETLRAEISQDVDWEKTATAASPLRSSDESVPYSYVEVERDQRVKRLKNKGLWAPMPNNRFKGHLIRLRPQQHGYISVLRQQWTREIREALGLKKNDPMPAGGSIELNRRLVLATIVGYRGCFHLAGQEVDLSNAEPAKVQAFFGKNYLMPIDLENHERPETYDDFDLEFLNTVLETHEKLDAADYDEIDKKKEGFVLGQSKGDDYAG